MLEKVVTFTPPPQEPGAVPINISNMVIKKGFIGQVTDFNRVESCGTCVDGLKKSGQRLTGKRHPLESIGPFQQKDDHRSLAASTSRVLESVNLVCRLKSAQNRRENENF